MPWMGVEWENLNWIQPLNHSRLFNPQKGNFVRFYRCQNTLLNRKLECLKCVQPFKFIQVYSSLFKSIQDFSRLECTFGPIHRCWNLEKTWMNLNAFNLSTFQVFIQVFSSSFKFIQDLIVLLAHSIAIENLNKLEWIWMYSTFKTIQVFIQVFSRFFKGVKGLEKCLFGGAKKTQSFLFSRIRNAPVVWL